MLSGKEIKRKFDELKASGLSDSKARDVIYLDRTVTSAQINILILAVAKERRKKEKKKNG